MNFMKNNSEYKYLIEDIINNIQFSELNNIAHHGETRMDHSLKVSYYSYKITKFLRLDYKATARAGLLHDFYLDRTKDYQRVKDKVKLFSFGHPKDAVENASKLFYLSDKEKDIIRTHMFPIDIKIPKYLESWVVNVVDKCISMYEFTKKFSYQFNAAINLWLILFINIRK